MTAATGSVHPADGDLVAWLETGRPGTVGRHVDSCSHCLDRLDELTDLPSEVRSELGAVVAPPPDLAGRTTDQVRSRVAAQEAASLLVELFVLPWSTFEILAGRGSRARGVAPSSLPGRDDADDDRERRDG